MGISWGNESLYYYVVHEKYGWWKFKRFQVLKLSAVVHYPNQDAIPVVADKLTYKEAYALTKLLGA